MYSRFSSPNESLALIIDNLWLGVEKFVLQGLKRLVVQFELELEYSVGQPASLLEELHNLIEYLIKFHHRFSTSANAAFVSGNQNVISISRYISIAVDSSARACSGCPV